MDKRSKGVNVMGFSNRSLKLWKWSFLFVLIGVFGQINKRNILWICICCKTIKESQHSIHNGQKNMAIRVSLTIFVNLKLAMCPFLSMFHNVSRQCGNVDKNVDYKWFQQESQKPLFFVSQRFTLAWTLNCLKIYLQCLVGVKRYRHLTTGRIGKPRWCQAS